MNRSGSLREHKKPYKVIPPQGRRTKPIVIEGIFADPEAKRTKEAEEMVAVQMAKFGLFTK